MAVHVHSYAGYCRDKRCPGCHEAALAYWRGKSRAIAYGTWQPFVDAAPVRERLLMLRGHGIGRRRVAELAGVDVQRLARIVAGQPVCRPALAAAVLAVQPSADAVAAGALVDATGARRRLQGLVARGWPQTRLAVRLDTTNNRLADLLTADRVTARMAAAVRVLYSELWDADPRQLGVCTQAFNRARNKAVALGWLPPAAWDDDAIDDPGAKPPMHAVRDAAA